MSKTKSQPRATLGEVLKRAKEFCVADVDKTIAAAKRSRQWSKNEQKMYAELREEINAAATFTNLADALIRGEDELLTDLTLDFVLDALNQKGVSQ